MVILWFPFLSLLLNTHSGQVLYAYVDRGRRLQQALLQERSQAKKVLGQRMLLDLNLQDV